MSSKFKANMGGYEAVNPETARNNIDKQRQSGGYKFYPWYKERLWQYPGEVSKLIFTLDNSFNPNDERKGVPYTYDCVFTAPKATFFDKETKEVKGNKYAKFFVPSPSAYGEDCPIQTRFLNELSGCQGRTSANGQEYIPAPMEYFNLSALQYSKTYKNKQTGQIVKLKNGNFPVVLALEGRETKNKKGDVVKEIYTFEILNLLESAYKEVNPETGKPYNSIDGVEIWLERGKATTSSPVGRPVVIGDTGKLFRRHTKKKLLSNFGHAEKVSAAGNVYAKKDEDITQFDINEVCFRPTEKLICELFDLPYQEKAGANDNVMYGSDQFKDDEFSDGDPSGESIEGLNDDIPFDTDDDIGSETDSIEKESVDTLSDDDIKELEDLNLDDELGDLDLELDKA